MKIYNAFFKPLCDRSVGVVFSLLTLPLILVLLLLIRAGSPGKPIFVQIRVGRFGRHFKIFKLRSMVVNDGRQISADAGDKRVTPIGRFIRKTSLDELPQFWNLALGDMSLIGPRPDLPQQVELYQSWEWAARNQVRPGITGLSQALLRSKATVSQRKRLDLFYASKASFLLDVKIVIKTFQTLFGRDLQT